MKFCKWTLGIIVMTLILSCCCVNQVFAASSDAYKSEKINGVGVKYVTLDMKDKNIQPRVLNAQNQICATESLASMAKKAGAFTAMEPILKLTAVLQSPGVQSLRMVRCYI